MPTSEHRAIAEAIKDALNTQITALGAVRAYKTDIRREELSGTTVIVVPATQTIEPETRANSRHRYTVDLGIFRPIADIESETEIDAGMDDVEEITQLFDQDGALRRQKMNGATWQGIENDPAWDPENLDKAVFASRLRLTYHKTK